MAVRIRVQLTLPAEIRPNKQVTYGVFRVTIDKEDLASIEATPHSVVFALLGMLRERGLLSIPLSSWSWRADFKKNGILGKDWLSFYEAVRRKWTTDKAMVSAVKSHPVLGKMLDDKVTFLEDRIFDAYRINIARRVFAPTAAKVKKTKSTSGTREGSGTITITDFEYE